MKKRIISLLMLYVLFGSIFLTLPALGDTAVTLNPSNPKPSGSVTFTATFSENESVANVVIYIEECEEGLCFTDNFNETMNSVGNNVYEKTITLRHSTAIELKYRVGYSTSTGWEWYPAGGANARIEVDLDTSGDGNGNTNGNESPGFEVMPLFIAVIFISYMFVKRRR